jgi:hypothetical protein
MNNKQTHFDWYFALQWLVSCMVGTAVLGMVAYASMWRLGEAAGQAGNNELITVLVAGALFGTFLALGGTLGPGLLLRRVGISAGRWIGYSILVAAIAMSAGVTLISSQNYPMQEPAVSALFVGLALGLPMGLVQWLLLKQQGVSAAIWPLITVTAYILAFGIVVYFSGEGREWLVLGGMGLTLGAVTGLGMMWVLRQETAVAV